MWWNNVLKRLEITSPSRMADRYGLVFVDGDGHPVSVGDWNYNPTIAPECEGQPLKYWEGTSSVILLSQSDRDAIDAAEQAALKEDERLGQRDRINKETAIRAVVDMQHDMYNLLKNRIRPEALTSPLPSFSEADVRQQFLDRVNSYYGG